MPGRRDFFCTSGVSGVTVNDALSRILVVGTALNHLILCRGLSVIEPLCYGTASLVVGPRKGISKPDLRREPQGGGHTTDHQGRMLRLEQDDPCLTKILSSSFPRTIQRLVVFQEVPIKKKAWDGDPTLGVSQDLTLGLVAEYLMVRKL